ncbi:hypothetical protein PybrP1_004152 [[Pythium] brassicae (nom. inval.)]|nr:hypothetical protein PybrP1_004152 [[Pythium] brassicae (nom. inval.)]
MSTLRSGRNLMLTGVAGVAIAAYGVYVEHQKRLHQSKYSALCDSKYFSCSKVMTSEFGSLLSYHGVVASGSALDQPNAVLGLFAYLLFALYPVLRAVPFHAYFYVIASTCALLASGYLALILAFVLKSVCLVCIASYVVNVLLFWNSLQLLYDDQVASRRRQHAKAKQL